MSEAHLAQLRERTRLARELHDIGSYGGRRGTTSAPERAYEIFQAAAEALRNAFQHSRGTRIEVELSYEARQLRLRIRDDGRGINRNVIAAGGRGGHFELRGMRERVALAGGKLTVWSAPDCGTEVEFIVPASAAYAAPVVSSALDPDEAGAH